MRTVEAGLSRNAGSTAAEGAGAQLRFAGERYDAGDESGEGDLSRTSDRLRGPGCVLPAEPGAMAGEVGRRGGAGELSDQRTREPGLESLPERGVRQRAMFLYQQLDTLRGLRREAKKA